MIIYYNGFAFHLYSMQYKIVFFKQSFINQCCTRNTFSKVIVHCTFLVFKRNADECKISVLNYVICGMVLEHYIINVWTPRFFFFFSPGIHKRQFYTFWVVHKVCLVIVLVLNDTFFWQWKLRFVSEITLHLHSSFLSK